MCATSCVLHGKPKRQRAHEQPQLLQHTRSKQRPMSIFSTPKLAGPKRHVAQQNATSTQGRHGLLSPGIYKNPTMRNIMHPHHFAGHTTCPAAASRRSRRRTGTQLPPLAGHAPPKWLPQTSCRCPGAPLATSSAHRSPPPEIKEHPRAQQVESQALGQHTRPHAHLQATPLSGHGVSLRPSQRSGCTSASLLMQSCYQSEPRPQTQTAGG